MINWPTQDHLQRLLVAARDDVILAAWLAVLIEHLLPAEAEVAPFDHWDSYQCFFLHGLVSADDFNAIDVKKKFFSGIRPSHGSIYQAMQDFKILRHNANPNPMEAPMSKAKPPIDAFTGDTAMARPAAGEVARRRSELPRSAPTNLAAFKPTEQAPQSLGTGRPAREFAAFKEQAALPCTTEDQSQGRSRFVDARMFTNLNELSLQMICCGHPMELTDDDNEIFDPDVMLDDDHPIREYLFHCECKNCGTHFSTTAGKPIPSEHIR